MKHVFTIHSPITFLMAYTIIKDEQIPEDDVIIISSGYKPPIELKYIKKSFQEINNSFFKKIKTWNTPKAYDKYINHLTQGKKYIAYIDLMAMYQRILITNPKCIGFHFIEEGSASYVKANNLKKITHPFRSMPFRYNNFSSLLKGLKFLLRGYSLKLFGMPYWPDSYKHFELVKFYCLSNKAYPGVISKNKVVLKLNDKSSLINEMAQNISLFNEFIWIEDSFTRTFNMPDELYINAVTKMIKYLKHNSTFSKIFIKLRPNQKQGDSIVYKKLNELDFDIEVINNDIIIEALLVKSQNCTLIGNVSSVLFYAPLLGHKSISMFDRIKNKPKTTFDDFDIFWENIERI